MNAFLRKYVLGLTLILLILSIGCEDLFPGKTPTPDGTPTTQEPSTPIDPVVYVNQAGYLLAHPKYFITTHASDFTVIDTASGNSVLSGKSVLHKTDDPSTDMTTYIGDFSDLQEQGLYKILLTDGTESYPFPVADDVFNDVARKSLLSFYYQRCGMELTTEFAGEFAHGNCHRDPIVYHNEAVPGKSGENLEAFGGWHDAGDYGKYTHTGSQAAAFMMMAYERFPQKYGYDDSGIPESGDSVPDILNEVRYELEWLFTMQDPADGGAYYMINTLGYEWAFPDNAHDQQYVYGKSSVATANLTAVLAQAARIFEPFDSAFAQLCLTKAQTGWSFLENNPTLYPAEGHKRPADTETGGYAESADMNDKDERLWAALELFLTTGDSELHDYVKSALNATERLNEDVSWLDISLIPKIQYISGSAADGVTRDATLQALLADQLTLRCQSLVTQINNNGFKTSLKSTEYYWGSNGNAAGRAMILIMGYEETQNIEFYNAALAQLNYILGINAHNMSFVTETGTVFPEKIHHVVMDTDSTSKSIPGLVTGGPNSGRGWGERYQDPTMSSRLDHELPPALCYIDHSGSWASNENCILYNMPLVFAAGYFINPASSPVAP